MSVARGAIVPTAVERAQTAFLTGAERGTYCAAVDENFQNLMQELGEAINDARSGSIGCVERVMREDDASDFGNLLGFVVVRDSWRPAF